MMNDIALLDEGQWRASDSSARRMSLDAGISFANVRYSSRSNLEFTAPASASATKTSARSPDEATLAEDVMIESASFADFFAYGTAFTSTRERSPLDGTFSAALK